MSEERIVKDMVLTSNPKFLDVTTLPNLVKVKITKLKVDPQEYISRYEHYSHIKRIWVMNDYEGKIPIIHNAEIRKGFPDWFEDGNEFLVLVVGKDNGSSAIIDLTADDFEG